MVRLAGIGYEKNLIRFHEKHLGSRSEIDPLRPFFVFVLRHQESRMRHAENKRWIHLRHSELNRRYPNFIRNSYFRRRLQINNFHLPEELLVIYWSLDLRWCSTYYVSLSNPQCDEGRTERHHTSIAPPSLKTRFYSNFLHYRQKWKGQDRFPCPQWWSLN